MMMKECCCVLFARETKLTDENVPPPPPPPLDANSQVEEETNPQIETQAQKDAHEIEVIFFSTQNERKRFQNRSIWFLDANLASFRFSCSVSRFSRSPNARKGKRAEGEESVDV